MKWQKKPQVFEAEQWTGPGCYLPGVVREWVPGDSPAGDGTYYYYVVTAHSQRVYLAPGDWVVPEPDGRGYYPIKDDIIRTIADPVS